MTQWQQKLQGDVHIHKRLFITNNL